MAREPAHTVTRGQIQAVTLWREIVTGEPEGISCEQLQVIYFLKFLVFSMLMNSKLYYLLLLMSSFFNQSGSSLINRFFVQFAEESYSSTSRHSRENVFHRCNPFLAKFEFGYPDTHGRM
jgi:hypothetical protein